MKIDLRPDQKQWLEAEVASGRFGSISEAVEMAIAGLMIGEADDLAWAKPLVNGAHASVVNGDARIGDEYLDFLNDEIAKRRAK